MRSLSNRSKLRSLFLFCLQSVDVKSAVLLLALQEKASRSSGRASASAHDVEQSDQFIDKEVL